MDGCGWYLVRFPLYGGGGTGWNVLGLPPIMCVWLRKQKKEGVVDGCGWYLVEIPGKELLELDDDHWLRNWEAGEYHTIHQ